MCNWRRDLGLQEEDRDGDTDLGITCITVKIETIGTDKITEERGSERRESLQETCIFRGFQDDKDPEQRVLKPQSQVQLRGLRKDNWDRDVIGTGQLST